MATGMFQPISGIIRRYLCAILTGTVTVPVNHSGPPFDLLHFFSCTR